VSAPSSPTPATRAAQPNAPAAGGHDHATHALEEKMPRVGPEELKRLLAAGQAVVIDVRSAEEYRQGHIPGAINLPVSQIEAGSYPRLPRDKRLISYCA
jgi:3-mercaptopyruvate sulfurtransferase SseA